MLRLQLPVMQANEIVEALPYRQGRHDVYEHRHLPAVTVGKAHPQQHGEWWRWKNAASSFRRHFFGLLPDTWSLSAMVVGGEERVEYGEGEGREECGGGGERHGLYKTVGSHHARTRPIYSGIGSQDVVNPATRVGEDEAQHVARVRKPLKL